MQTRVRVLSSILTLAVGVAFSANSTPALAASKSKAAKPKSQDIVDTAKSNGSFNTLTGALQKTGLSKKLHSKGPFTVFAPSDSAFAKLPDAQKEKILNDSEKLPEILKYHVVEGIFPVSDLADKTSIKTVQGESLMIRSKDDGEVLVVDGALVTQPDIKCRNGMIHVIDFLLVPERGK